MGAYAGAFLSLSRCGYVVVVAQDDRGTGDQGARRLEIAVNTVHLHTVANAYARVMSVVWSVTAGLPGQGRFFGCLSRTRVNSHLR